MELGITVKKTENFSKWYTQVITKAELIDYYDVSGCYVLRPWAYAIWEQIQQYVDKQLKRKGVKNAYFPLLVSQAALTKEKDHIEGFAPEVAWVTKSGSSDLNEPLAIRPTSETIMYPYFAKWIRSHRDLPLKINQWCNVVRWEFKDPIPFLRSREFLWQEGHSAFATLNEADQDVLDILELYRSVFENLLAIPVIKGRKSDNEKFAGAHYTTTCEAFIPTSGRAIQGATAHCLGQNFSKMFEMTYLNDADGNNQYVWQTSWGLTTRTIGIMIMMHGDDKGLIIPPKVAPIQVIIIPIISGNSTQADTDLLQSVQNIVVRLAACGVRVEADTRDNYRHTFKYNHWEMMGVPLRIEYGPKEFTARQVTLVSRSSGSKLTSSLDGLETRVTSYLDVIQENIFAKACMEHAVKMATVTTWTDFMTSLNQGYCVQIPWCQNVTCEEDIKQRTRHEFGSVKSLCIPFQQRAMQLGTECIACSNTAKVWCLFGRSY
jgi:prolyl-tRNA synthetase